jgi:hypothetical protein
VQSYVRPQRAALATVVPDGSSQAGTQSIIRAVSAGRFPGFPVGGLTAMPSSSHCARNWSVSVPLLLRVMPLSRCEQSCWQAPRLRPTGSVEHSTATRARDLFYAHQHQAHLGHKDHQNNYEDHEKDCAPHSVQSRPYSRFMEYPRQPATGAIQAWARNATPVELPRPRLHNMPQIAPHARFVAMTFIAH